jgi:RNA polymerase sigma-70 factor, ECF subfamily
MDAAKLAEIWTGLRPELAGYLRRLLVRPDQVEDVCQTTYLKALEALDRVPADRDQARAWMFRIATNTALDERKRHSTWRESALHDLRARAESDPSFLRRSEQLIGTPETKAIAREHLAACFACVLRSFPQQKAAALLLKEVHGFTLAQIAQWVGASPVQVKNWLQETRREMERRYEATCALISKQGVCHQCVELDGFFGANAGAPLPPGGTLESRLAVLRELRSSAASPWHDLMFGLLDDPALS